MNDDDMNDDDMNDDELLSAIGAAFDGPVPDAPDDRVAAVRAAAVRERSMLAAATDDERSGSFDEAHQGAVSPIRPVSSRRTWLISSAAAVVGIATGVTVGQVGDDDAPAAAPSPPTEPLTFVAGAAAVDGVALTGKVINHTWGVELLLDASGFPVGSPYRVVYLDTDRAMVEAGGFVGAAIPIHCRCNAALLRDHIGAIEIRDATDAVVSRADFT